MECYENAEALFLKAVPTLVGILITSVMDWRTLRICVLMIYVMIPEMPVLIGK